MKKTISLCIAALLLLGLASAGLAETVTLEDYGMTLEIPDGMTWEDASTDSDVAIDVVIKSDVLQYTVTITYDETMAGKTFADLEPETAAEVEAAFTSQIEGATVTYEPDEATGLTYMIVQNPEGTALIVGVMNDGEMLMVSAAKSDGEALTEEDAAQLNDILNSITFAEAGEDTGAEAEEEAE